MQRLMGEVVLVPTASGERAFVLACLLLSASIALAAVWAVALRPASTLEIIGALMAVGFTAVGQIAALSRAITARHGLRGIACSLLLPEITEDDREQLEWAEHAHTVAIPRAERK